MERHHEQSEKMNIYEKYETVIGLEVHAQLLTRSKAFAPDPNSYGESPNSMVSPITLGHPGTLPKLNRKVVEYAIRLGLATRCKINRDNFFARKNYFYPDLPKGYQITQFETPICTGGRLRIRLESGEKWIGITRIHIEEDAGKSMHDIDPYYTLIDLNRAGVPLLEIVSEPDMKSPEEAYRYLTEIRKLLRYLEICDGNMEEGSLRCDANVSVMLKGSKEYGQKVEVKNMNSIRNVANALRYEVRRQIEALERGESIDQDTRSFDPVEGVTRSMRSKEMAHDYRYFTEPDLPPLYITKEMIDEVQAAMPPLPDELFVKYVKELGLTEYDAGVLTGDKDIALFFEELITKSNDYKAAANWVMGPVKSYLNEQVLSIDEFPLSPSDIAGLMDLIAEGKTNFSIATQRIFPLMLKNPGKSARDIAREENLIQESDTDAIMVFIEEALAAYPDKVEEYRKGKKGVIGLFMGEVMKRSKGKADPRKANALLREKLEK